MIMHEILTGFYSYMIFMFKLTIERHLTVELTKHIQFGTDRLIFWGCGGLSLGFCIEIRYYMFFSFSCRTGYFYI